MADLKPGDYIGLYLEDNLVYTGVLKDQGMMESGRKIQQVQEEIKRLKIKLQKSIEKMEGDHVQQLITEKELHNIIG